jgi:hypothetical protein
MVGLFACLVTHEPETKQFMKNAAPPCVDSTVVMFWHAGQAHNCADINFT